MDRVKLVDVVYVERNGLEDHHAGSEFLGSGLRDCDPHPQCLLQQVSVETRTKVDLYL